MSLSDIVPQWIYTIFSSKTDSVRNNKIESWSDLLSCIDKQILSDPNSIRFLKLKSLVKKNCCKDDLDSVLENGLDRFSYFKLLYQQLLIETEITGVVTGVPYITKSPENNSCGEKVFCLTCNGKWIKINRSNRQLDFIDEKLKITNDKQINKFLKGLDNLRKDYTFFGKHPVIYYKFLVTPSQRALDYLIASGVTPIGLDEKTADIDVYENRFAETVILDRPVVIMLCSDILYESNPAYTEKFGDNQIFKLIEEKNKIDSFIKDKKIIMPQTFYDTFTIFDVIAGPKEKERYAQLLKTVELVPDCHNPRFDLNTELKDQEKILLSLAEKNFATILTTNNKLTSKIEKCYKELRCKNFIGVQLVENTKRSI